MKAGFGLTLNAVILQLPTVCAEGMLRVLVALFQVALMVTGVLLQLERILKLTPVTVPAVALEAVRVQGRFSRTGTPHSELLPLTVAPVIEALEPLAATVPVKLMLQLTGIPNDAGEDTEMVPGAEKDAPAGAMVAALAIDAAPRQMAKEATDTRVLMLCIVVFLKI